MLEESTNLKNLGQTARSSSTRAYAGHSADMRHIFDMKVLNLTEYARSFGLYKQLYLVIQKDKKDAKTMEKRGMVKNDATSNYNSINTMNPDLNLDKVLEKAIAENQQNFSRRLQKSKIKDLEKDLQKSLRNQDDLQSSRRIARLQDDLSKAKKDVFTDERKIEQRKAGFLKAKTNIRKAMISEFSM